MIFEKQRCIENGMKLKFVDRNEYRSRNNEYYIEKLKNTYKNSVIIPEGGTNEKGIKGCEEILSDYDKAFFDVICPKFGLKWSSKWTGLRGRDPSGATPKRSKNASATQPRFFIVLTSILDANLVIF